MSSEKELDYVSLRRLAEYNAEILKRIKNTTNSSQIFTSPTDLDSWLKDEDNKGTKQVGDTIYINNNDNKVSYYITEVLQEPDVNGYYYHVSEIVNVTELTENFYEKPEGGIPYDDLAEDVQEGVDNGNQAIIKIRTLEGRYQKEYTYAEYLALPDEVKYSGASFYIKDFPSEENEDEESGSSGTGGTTPSIVASSNYSVNEEATGTWLDSRILYKKTFIFSFDGTTDEYKRIIQDVDIPSKEIKNIECFVVSNTGDHDWIPASCRWGDTLDSFSVMARGTSLYFRLDTDMTSATIYATIYYTKEVS